MNCAVIYSPFAKRGKINKYLEKIKKQLSKKYENIDFFRTEYMGHGRLISSMCCNQYDLIVAVGGDGIFSEVVSGLAERERKPLIGLIPAGTVNDLTRTFNISSNLNKALDVILQENIFEFDILKINNGYGVYELSCGTCTECTYNTKQDCKKLFGWWAYFAKGFLSFFKNYKIPLTISIDEKLEITEVFSFILFVNSRSVAGFKLNKNAKLDDGFVDIIMFKNNKKGIKGFFQRTFNFFRLLKLFFCGLKHFKTGADIIRTQGKNIKIFNPNKTQFNIDGEAGECENNINLKVLQKEVNLIVPSNFKRIFKK